jgi:hypothetical protein
VTTVTEVTIRLAAWLRRLPPAQERIDRLLAELEERFAGRTEPITEDACAEIERVAWPYSRHLPAESGARMGTGALAARPCILQHRLTRSARPG